MYIHVAKSVMWLIYCIIWCVTDLLCTYMYVKPRGLVLLWKCENDHIVLWFWDMSVHVVLCAVHVCVGSQYDTGTMHAAAAQCQSYAGVDSSSTQVLPHQHYLVLNQSDCPKFWHQELNLTIVKNSFSRDVCNAHDACTASVILWAGLMCGSQHTKF